MPNIKMKEKKMKPKKESLKDWCKEWSLEDIVYDAGSKGMEFMAGRCSSRELLEHRNILVKELKRRIK